MDWIAILIYLALLGLPVNKLNVNTNIPYILVLKNLEKVLPSKLHMFIIKLLSTIKEVIINIGSKLGTIFLNHKIVVEYITLYIISFFININRKNIIIINLVSLLFIVNYI